MLKTSIGLDISTPPSNPKPKFLALPFIYYCNINPLFFPPNTFASEASFLSMQRALASTVHAAAVGPPSLHRSFRRATASTVHAVVGSVDAASASEHRPRRSIGVRLACTDPSGERQRAPSTPRWDPSSLQRFFRRAIASSVHACFKGAPKKWPG